MAAFESGCTMIWKSNLYRTAGCFTVVCFYYKLSCLNPPLSYHISILFSAFMYVNVCDLSVLFSAYKFIVNWIMWPNGYVQLKLPFYWGCSLHKVFFISFYWQAPRCFIPKIEHDKIGANNGQAMLVFMSGFFWLMCRLKVQHMWAPSCGSPVASACGIVHVGKTCWIVVLRSMIRTVPLMESTWQWGGLSLSSINSLFKVSALCFL